MSRVGGGESVFGSPRSALCVTREVAKGLIKFNRVDKGLGSSEAFFSVVLRKGKPGRPLDKRLSVNREGWNCLNRPDHDWPSIDQEPAASMLGRAGPTA